MGSTADLVGQALGARSPVVDRVVIVGGGLGGLSAAIQLRKRGIDAQVYEKNESIMGGGEGTLISIFPNGLRALHAGAKEIVEKIKLAGLPSSNPSSKARIIDPKGKGKEISDWKLSSEMEGRYGFPMVAILWRHALGVLSSALPGSCLHTGYELVSISEGEGEAVATFKKDHEDVLVKASLIIGADGIHSVLRSFLFGLITPNDNGRTMWRAVIDSDLVGDERAGSLAAMSGGRTVFVVNRVHGKLYWAFSLTDEVTDGSAKIRSKSKQEAKDRLLEAFKDWEYAYGIIKVTDPELILERRVLDLDVLPKWSSRHVVLLGDAVHAVPPSLGQGANMAYEDGLELALQLSSSSDLRMALERYEKIRIPRAEQISEMSRSFTGRTDEFYDWLYSYSSPSI